MVTRRELIEIKAKKMSEIYSDLEKDGDVSKAKMRIGWLGTHLKKLSKSLSSEQLENLFNDDGMI